MPNEKDYITNKVLVVFTACLVGVLGLMYLYNMLNHGDTFLTAYFVVRALLGVGAIAVVGGIARGIFERKNNLDMKYKLVTGRNIAIVGAVIAGSMALILWDMFGAIPVLYVVLPAIAVYYLVFHSYQREFFVLAVDTGLAAGFLWIIAKAHDSGVSGWMGPAVVVVGVVLAAAQLVLLRKIQADGGLMKIGGQSREIFSSGCNYLLLYVTAAAMALALLVGFFAGAQISIYLMFAVFAYLFILAVYYTVKLM